MPHIRRHEIGYVSPGTSEPCRNLNAATPCQFPARFRPPPPFRIMSSFVAPARATARTQKGSFIEWFEEHCLKRYWDEGFSPGVLVLPLPDRLCVTFL